MIAMNRPSFTWKLYIAAFYRLPVRAAPGRGRLRLQREPVSLAALAGLHARMVHRHRRARQARHVRGSDLAERSATASRWRSPWRCSRCSSAPSNAWLLERAEFPGKTLLDMMMIWPLVIPGVVLGISILAFFSARRQRSRGLAPDRSRSPAARPVARRARAVLVPRHDHDAHHRRAPAQVRRSLEEAALNLGASRARVLRTVTLPFLRPALIGAGLVALPHVVREFQHHADARRLRLAADRSPCTARCARAPRRRSTRSACC